MSNSVTLKPGGIILSHQILLISDVFNITFNITDADNSSIADSVTCLTDAQSWLD